MRCTPGLWRQAPTLSCLWRSVGTGLTSPRGVAAGGSKDRPRPVTASSSSPIPTATYGVRSSISACGPRPIEAVRAEAGRVAAPWRIARASLRAWTVTPFGASDSRRWEDVGSHGFTGSCPVVGGGRPVSRSPHGSSVCPRPFHGRDASTVKGRECDHPAGNATVRGPLVAAHDHLLPACAGLAGVAPPEVLPGQPDEEEAWDRSPHS
jgi:hypothetical protein